MELGNTSKLFKQNNSVLNVINNKLIELFIYQHISTVQNNF